MSNLMTNVKSALGKGALFLTGAVLAGLGLATVGVLALFALGAMGLALIAAPLIALVHPSEPATVNAEPAEA